MCVAAVELSGSRESYIPAVGAACLYMGCIVVHRRDAPACDLADKELPRVGDVIQARVRAWLVDCDII